MQEERRLVEQPLGRLDVLDDHAACHGVELRVLFGRELPPGEDDDGQIGQRRLVANLLEDGKPRHVGQAQVEHDTVEMLVVQPPEGLGRRCRPLTISMSSWPSRAPMLNCSASSSSITNKRLRRGAA